MEKQITDVTGFKLIPIYREIGRKKLLVKLKIEYLSKGEIIAKGWYQFDNQREKNKSEQLEEIRQILLNIVKNNLKVEKETTLGGVINMFKLDIKNKHGYIQDLRIEFLRNGDFFAETVFKKVTSEQVKHIQEILADNTQYNLTAENQCSAVTLLDLLAICNP
ncbi:MAG: hypothetical protein V8R82_04740 [Clostridia bacterium]